jgi:hypothetical protein
MINGRHDIGAQLVDVAIIFKVEVYTPVDSVMVLAADAFVQAMARCGKDSPCMCSRACTTDVWY